MDQTRIFINNIPKFYKDKELIEQFSTVGDLTDCKILRTNKGKSRGFAFVGYKTHEEAQKAIEKFNNTFITTSKIQVQFAKPIGDESLEECYARVRKAPKVEKRNKNKDNDEPQNETPHPKRPSLADDPEYQEFLAARRAKRTLPSWNEGLDEFVEQHQKEIEQESSKKTKKKHSEKGDLNATEEEEDSTQNNDMEHEDENEEDNTKYNSTRVYITNLPYSATEDELEEFFSKYGEVIEAHVQYDKIAQRGKGRGYVTFSTYEGLISAMKDSVTFQGRALKLKPAENPPNHNNAKEQLMNDDDEPYLKKKRREMKIEKPESWNSLFLNKDTVAEATARMLGFTKSQILNPESDEIASRLAIAESQLVNETKEMFQKAGIDLSLFDTKLNSSNKLSKTLIIVKNLKYESTEEEVRNMFAAYGSLVRFIFPPTHAVALVEFARPEDAKKAYQALCFKKLHDQPIYLQWAPSAQGQSNHLEDNDEESTNKKASIKQLKTTTLIMKNVPFKATKKEIYDLVNAYAKVKAVRMPKKADGSGHRGFVFLDFNTRQEATSAMENLGNVHLYDRHLVVQPAEVGRNADSIVQENLQKE
ncbi:hypothetical protein M9Y10_005554 [Tritrichomonas musculus]|uniref:RRM domain-containing protein n=1 Tax=Tritrichomonas musculus TaxID=1915356 RepID=A0ABR2JC53_9EUKA